MESVFDVLAEPNRRAILRRKRPVFTACSASLRSAIIT
jgi:hypothetical protein